MHIKVHKFSEKVHQLFQTLRPPAGDYYIRKAGTDEHLIVRPKTGFLQVDSARRDQFRLEYKGDSPLSFSIYWKNQCIEMLPW